MDLDRLKAIEDEVQKVLEGWSKLKLAIAYQWINGQGIRMDNISDFIRKELKKESPPGSSFP